MPQGGIKQCSGCIAWRSEVKESWCRSRDQRACDANVEAVVFFHFSSSRLHGQGKNMYLPHTVESGALDEELSGLARSNQVACVGGLLMRGTDQMCQSRVIIRHWRWFSAFF